MGTSGHGTVVQPSQGKALRFLGDLYVVKTDGEASKGAFSVTEMTIAPAPQGGARCTSTPKRTRSFTSWMAR